jgi:hypothetical protein
MKASSRNDRIAPDGYTEWPTDHEIILLASKMNKAKMNIANNQGTIAFRAMNSILSRLPQDSATYAELVEVGQAFYNLIGNVATAIDYVNGNYEIEEEAK